MPIVEYHLVPEILPVEQMYDGEELTTFFEYQNLTLSSPATSDFFFTVNAAESTADITSADNTAGLVSSQASDVPK